VTRISIGVRRLARLTVRCVRVGVAGAIGVAAVAAAASAWSDPMPPAVTAPTTLSPLPRRIDRAASCTSSCGSHCGAGLRSREVPSRSPSAGGTATSLRLQGSGWRAVPVTPGSSSAITRGSGGERTRLGTSQACTGLAQSAKDGRCWEESSELFASCVRSAHVLPRFAKPS
jgi:hypothetical protein